MKEVNFRILANNRIAKNIYKLLLAGDTSEIQKPGQFVNIRVNGCYLRRPISVCDKDTCILTLVYKVVGNGTEILSRTPPGETLNLLTGLGNGYDLTKSGKAPLLIGGGVGIPPLYSLCKELINRGVRPTVILGFNSIGDIFFEAEFEALGAKVFITTVDGSYGDKGLVTDIVKRLDYTYFYTCGPEPMFRALSKVVKTPGQYSFEERMGCGFGACMGCSCKTLTGNKRICKEGPVLESEEIIW